MLSVHIFLPGTAHAQDLSRVTPATEAMILMSGDEWQQARAKVIASRSPALVKAYEWMLYRENYDNLPFEGVAAFIEQNPEWPDQAAIRRTAERNMPATMDPSAVMGWFAKHPPLTGRGMIILLRAANAKGQTAQAQGLVAESWAEAEIAQDDLKTLMGAIGRALPAKAHVKRLDKLLFAGKYTPARQLAGFLGPDYQALVEARIALAEDKDGAPTLLSRVPARLRNDTGLLFERLSWRRRHDEDAGAIAILDQSPDLTEAPNQTEWWKERHIMIRRLIEAKDYRAAYRLAARHGQIDKASQAESEWMAGWLSLRFLNNPGAALPHFKAMYDAVGTAISKARGAYWIGRAYEQSGNKPEAANWYKIAAGYPRTYYGQIAATQGGITPVFQPVPVPTPQDEEKARRSALLEAGWIAHAAGLDTVHNLLIGAAIETLSTPSEFMAAAKKLDQAGDKAGSFRIAKAASWKNIDLGKYTYPALEREMSRINGDRALYHAIIRQESQFDTDARSPAGALGLMQLMPATAKETAGKLGIAHQTGWLTTRPEHNVTLGAAYIDRLRSGFDNAVPMAVAGYNAGPSRVRNWIEQFGDPRTGAVDWIDWIELIPVAETRNYVQRVMENYMVYGRKDDFRQKVASSGMQNQ